jgi:hypothetical protein
MVAVDYVLLATLWKALGDLHFLANEMRFPFRCDVSKTHPSAKFDSVGNGGRREIVLNNCYLRSAHPPDSGDISEPTVAA